MRIGIVFSSLGPNAGGGFVLEYEKFRAVQQMAHKSKHSFVIFCKDVNRKFREKDIDSKIKIVNIRNSLFDRAFSRLANTHFYEDMRQLFRIGLRSPFERLLAKEKIDFIWFPAPEMPSLVNIPYAVTVWDLQHRLQPWFIEFSSKNDWFNRERVYKTMLQRAAFIITGTRQGREEIKNLFQIPHERIRIFPLSTPVFSIDEKFDAERIYAKYSISGEFVFYPAQLWPHKNHYIILKALCYLRDQYKIDIPAVFSGSDKGNGAYIKRLVSEYNLQDSVKFLGFVSREEIAALYKSAFALVFPSYFGPDNLPPLEAFALECPVIASNVPGTDEQLRDAALLFDPKDHIQLGELIKKLREDKALRSELVRRGKRRAAELNINNYISGIFAMLDEFEPVRGCWE